MPGDHATGTDTQAVMVGAAADVVTRIEFRVGADEQNVLCWIELLANGIEHFGRADRQRHLQSFSACVIISRFGSNAQIRQHSDVTPFGGKFVR